MLQINTGKLFENGVGRTNRLRGVLYSNLKVPRESKIVTDAGTLLSTEGSVTDRAIVYELEENIEKVNEGPTVLISHTIKPYIQDFSTLLSFAFNAIASPDIDLVNRLTSGRAGLSSYNPPREYIRRCFDESIYLQDDEIEEFTAFVNQLLGLERRSFLGVVRAIRMYVSGVQRIYDDLSLAYALMVSALESLAQDLGGYESSWNDIDERKRIPIDRILSSAVEEVRNEIKDVIVSVEHHSLGRRYRELVLKHVDEAFFREGDALSGRPVARYELAEALNQSYSLRSRYIHNLRQLPDPLSSPFGHWEVAYVDRKPTLTLQGLSRLTRHVIKAVVYSSKTVEREKYNYGSERAGIVTMQMAPQYWLWQPLKKSDHASRRFEGFIEQLESLMSNVKDAKLTDIRSMLADIERMLPNAKKQHQASMVALYWMFNAYVSPELRMPDYEAVLKKHMNIITAPSCEMLFARTLMGKGIDWPLEQHLEAHGQYYRKRSKPSGLHLPRIFEAAITIDLAERCRIEGDLDKAVQLIASAVENFPGNSALLSLEAQFHQDMVIDWHEVLFSQFTKADEVNSTS